MLVGLTIIIRQPPSPTEPLLADWSFDAQELAAIETALWEAQLTNYSIENGNIKVPARQRARYLRALSQRNALPDAFYSLPEQALERSHFTELNSQREERLKQAYQRQIALAIRGLPGIANALVQYDQTPSRGFRSPGEVSAMVGLRSSDGKPIDTQTINTVRAMVLGFKAGLKPENLTITDIRSNRVYRGATADLFADQAARRAAIQHEWNDRISSLLKKLVPGAQVAVNVEVDHVGAPATPASVNASRQQAVDNAESQRLASTELVTVWVGVPSSYLERVCRARAARGTDPAYTAAARQKIEEETRQEIESAVAAVVPETSLANRLRPLVTVTTFEDFAAVEESHLQTLPRWFGEWWPTLGVTLLCLALCSLLARRRSRRTQRTVSRTTDSPAFKVVAESPSSTPANPLDTETLPDTQHPLREELRERVQRDPDAAAKAIAEWFDKAS
jgi:flagellar biosynthesis/type III secretory pathway M-ring protein FliF/YscJ